MLSDDSLHVSMLLLDCIIDDTRPSQINKINRYMERKKDEEISADVPTTSSPEHAGPRKSMIDITFQQKKNAMFGKLIINNYLSQVHHKPNFNSSRIKMFRNEHFMFFLVDFLDLIIKHSDLYIFISYSIWLATFTNSIKCIYFQRLIINCSRC